MPKEMTVAELIRVLKTCDPTFDVELYVTHEDKEFHADLISVSSDHKKSVSLNDTKFEYSIDVPSKKFPAATKLAVLDEIKKLRRLLLFACNRLNDGSAWADDGEGEFQEMCEAVAYKR